MFSDIKQLQRRSRRGAIALWKRRQGRPLAPPYVTATETRDEIVIRAHRMLELLRARRGGPHEHGRYDVTRILNEVGFLRAIALRRERVDPAGRAFYVSIRFGARHGLLYGPFDTQAAALRAVASARELAHAVNCGEAAFAEFGTCSIDRQHAKPGLLNAQLSPIAA